MHNLPAPANIYFQLRKQEAGEVSAPKNEFLSAPPYRLCSSDFQK